MDIYFFGIILHLLASLRCIYVNYVHIAFLYKHLYGKVIMLNLK